MVLDAQPNIAASYTPSNNTVLTVNPDAQKVKQHS